MPIDSFNPSVGILWGGTALVAGTWQGGGAVSIPRSGFCGVGPCSPPTCGGEEACFNPSVGILWGGTSDPASGRGRSPPFQSLGRDSVGWDGYIPKAIWHCMLVSIPRSGFCGVGPPSNCSFMSTSHLFQSLGRDSVGWDLNSPHQYQSLVRFQSLGRDSVGWDAEIVYRRLTSRKVSIPRSGFCGVGPLALAGPPGRG